MRFHLLKSPVAVAGLSLLLILGLLAGCGDSGSGNGQANGAGAQRHKAPHKGTAIVLGDEEYHLELVLDPAGGGMEAYVLDGEMENFVRVVVGAFEITAKLPGRDEVLVFNAVGNRSTGERVGDTACFESSAEWLKRERTFDGVLKELSVRGKTFRNVAFKFPQGNEPDEAGKK